MLLPVSRRLTSLVAIILLPSPFPLPPSLSPSTSRLLWALTHPCRAASQLLAIGQRLEQEKADAAVLRDREQALRDDALRTEHALQQHEVCFRTSACVFA